MKKDVKKALIELNIATFLFGFIGVIAKTITLSAPLTIFFRAVVAGVVLFVMMRIHKEKLFFEKRSKALIMVVLGVLFAAHWVTLFQAIKVSTVAVAMISLFTFPVMTVFLEPLFTEQHLKWGDVFSGLLILAGVYYMVPEFSLENDIFLGVLFGLLSAITYAFRNIFTRKYFGDLRGSSVMFFQMGVTIVVCSPILFFEEFVFVPMDFVYIVLLGVVFTALAHSLFVGSLRAVTAKTMGLVSSLQVVYAAFFAYVFLAEELTAPIFVGGACVLSAVLIEVFRVREATGIKKIDLEEGA